MILFGKMFMLTDFSTNPPSICHIFCFIPLEPPAIKDELFRGDKLEARSRLVAKAHEVNQQHKIQLNRRRGKQLIVPAQKLNDNKRKVVDTQKPF